MELRHSAPGDAPLEPRPWKRFGRATRRRRNLVLALAATMVFATLVSLTLPQAAQGSTSFSAGVAYQLDHPFPPNSEQEFFRLGITYTGPGHASYTYIVNDNLTKGDQNAVIDHVVLESGFHYNFSIVFEPQPQMTFIFHVLVYRGLTSSGAALLYNDTVES